jgi:hypothetical protein
VNAVSKLCSPGLVQLRFRFYFSPSLPGHGFRATAGAFSVQPWEMALASEPIPETTGLTRLQKSLTSSYPETRYSDCKIRELNHTEWLRRIFRQLFDNHGIVNKFLALKLLKRGCLRDILLGNPFNCKHLRGYWGGRACPLSG